MDPFSTLGIPRAFDQDLSAVEKTHRELSRALHPDRHVSEGASARKLALSRAVEVNEAWRIVRDEARRAEALFALGGIEMGELAEPKPSPDLLMEVLEMRESLADAKAAGDSAAIAGLAAVAEGRKQTVLLALSRGFAEAEGTSSRLKSLLPLLGELRFWRRFADEVSAIEDDVQS